MREDSTPAYQLGGPAAAFLRRSFAAALLLSALAAWARPPSSCLLRRHGLLLAQLACGGAFHNVPCLEADEAGVPSLLVPMLA
jgi:hypothetical protein